MDKNILYLSCIFASWCIFSTYGQGNLCEHDNLLIRQLQEQKAIPTFTVNSNTCKIRAEFELYSFGKPNFAIACFHDTFHIISLLDLQQPFIFDASTLATLYAYAIGLNNNDKGQSILDTWHQWSRLVPSSFMVALETALISQYPLFKARSIRALSHTTYIYTIDTTLIDRYVLLVKYILNKSSISSYEKSFITRIAELLTAENFLRNGSTLSRWIGHAKESIIKALNANPLGKEILDILGDINLQLKAEIEAYTTEPDFLNSVLR